MALLYHHFENGCFMADSQTVLDIRDDLRATMNECREVTEKYRTGRSAYLRIGQLFMRLFAGLLQQKEEVFDMCTAATYKTKDFYMGRTLDYEFSYGEQITITPRNYEFDFRFAGKIKSHYALIGMAFVAGGYPLLSKGEVRWQNK